MQESSPGHIGQFRRLHSIARRLGVQVNRYEAAEQAVSEVFGLPIELFTGKCRQWEVAEVRQALWMILRYDKETFVDIADEYSLDHTSIIHGVAVAKARFKESRWYRWRLEQDWAKYRAGVA